jgi:phage shock protein PspC (stress-responsive transcriptional regulator)
MYCVQCGAELGEGVKFCPKCGRGVSETGEFVRSKLIRPTKGKKVAGVCAAFANAYGWDVTAVRIITVLLALTVGGGVLAYLIAWICIPSQTEV